MNYLLHCLISPECEQIRIGNLIGDFVKGPLPDPPPTAIVQGLRLHRRLDRFCEDNRCFQRSKQCLDPRFGRYRGIMVDLFYDHFTAIHWSRYHGQPLEQFADELYTNLQHHHDLLPPSFQAILPRMIERNWLVSYRHIDTIERALHSISQRLRRPNELAQGIEQLSCHYRELEQGCHQFILQAQQFLAHNQP